MKNWINISGIILVSFVAILLIFALWFLNYYILKDLDCTQRGTFGDMFGAVNSLFSGLAFAGIIITIILQSRELCLQRNELTETRKEFNIQNHTLKLQRFENTFFNLLSIHHEIINSIDYTRQKRLSLSQQMDGVEPNIETFTSRDVFKIRYDELSKTLQNIEDFAELNSKYLLFYEKVQTDFGHYFRNLYRIIKFVDNSIFFDSLETIEARNKDFKIKYDYICMIRAQLSDYELLWLFYNGLSGNGIAKFKIYIEKYTLLKNMPQDKISNPNDLNFYEQSAFMKNTVLLG